MMTAGVILIILNNVLFQVQYVELSQRGGGERYGKTVCQQDCFGALAKFAEIFNSGNMLYFQNMYCY